MADPLQIDLFADRRVPFAKLFSFLGQDFSGSSLKLQVRPTRDTTNTPLIERTTSAGLSIPYTGTDTIANFITAGRLPREIYNSLNVETDAKYVAGDSDTLSQIAISFDVTNLAAVPFAPEVGDDAAAWYDIIRTPPVGDDEVIMRGKFIVQAGVTIP